HARAERPRPPLIVAAPRAVPRHGEDRVWVTGQDAWECGERRAETVTRLDAAQEEQPRALGEGVRGGPPVGPEELQVHAVRDDLPVGPEVARVRVHHGLAHRDRRATSGPTGRSSRTAWTWSSS